MLREAIIRPMSLIKRLSWRVGVLKGRFAGNDERQVVEFISQLPRIVVGSPACRHGHPMENRMVQPRHGWRFFICLRLVCASSFWRCGWTDGNQVGWDGMGGDGGCIVGREGRRCKGWESRGTRALHGTWQCTWWCSGNAYMTRARRWPFSMAFPEPATATRRGRHGGVRALVHVQE